MVNNNKSGLNKIENEILNTYVQITKDYSTEGNGSLKWITKAIKERIANVSKQHGFDSYSSIHGGEWLYDLVCVKNNESKELEKVSLVLESELNAGLEFDFRKYCRIFVMSLNSG